MWINPRASLIAPQRYKPRSGRHRKATQAPVRRRDINMPSGQGSTRQQTPHPLHDAPTRGLLGAPASMGMTRTLLKEEVELELYP